MTGFNETLITDCLTDKEPAMRCLGRLMSTSIAEDFADWARAECERGGDEHGIEMLGAASKFFGLLAQSIVHSHYKPEGRVYAMTFSAEKYLNAMRD